MRHICNRLQIGVSLVALASLGLFSNVAAAQDTAGAEEDAAQIVVTGSRIRGIEAVGSNVIAIDMADIQAEPVISTNDLLRRVPQVVSLGANRAAAAAAAEAAAMAATPTSQMTGLLK